jgi:tetratricopeptide (TPR) repeat protein
MKAFEQARLIAERTKDAKALGESLFLLCSGMGLMERKEEAQRLCMKALEVSREARDIETEGRTLVNLSMDYDDTATAIEMIQTAIEGCRTLNNRSCEAEPTAVMGLMLMKQGEKEKAVEAFDKVMELGTQLDSGEMKSVALIGLGLIQLQSGSFPEGLKSLEQGREIAAAIGNLQLEQMFATTLTPVYATLRRPEEVKRLLDRVGELAILMGNVGQYVNTVTGTAKLYLTQGNLDAATAACASLLDKADRIENKDAVKEVTLTLSQIYEIAGQDEKAKEYKDKAEKIPSGPEGAR